MNRSHTLRHMGIALIACFAVVGLSQCRFVDDSITGVDLKNNTSLSAKSACVRLCNEAYKDAMEREKDRHRDAKRACGNDKKCRDAEKDRHEAIKDAIKDAKKACKDGCYNEGSGSGGR